MRNSNTRSVLRPEYLEHSSKLSNVKMEEINSVLRVSTNTAPVYWLDNASKNKIQCNGKEFIRTNIQSSNLRKNLKIVVPKQIIADHPALRKSISTVSSRYESSDSDDVSQDHFPSPTSCSSRFSDSNVQTSLPKNSLRPLSQNTPDDIFTNLKTYSHGQTEQMRRSRESTTFALIDSQLSLHPLSQVREMYLQSRTNCGSSSSSTAARTTKKANLSVVHTVVRFRVKDYLLKLREHINKSLDTLFSHLYEDYETKSRETLACEYLGLSNVPCTSQCNYCQELFNKQTRSKTTFRQDYDYINFRNSQPDVHATSIDSHKPSISAHHNDSHSTIEYNKNAFKRQHDSAIAQPFTDSYELSMNTRFSMNSGLEWPLPSYHTNVFESRYCKRVRLDSTSLRLINEFDNLDWSANDIDFGPCGEELVDLNTLVNENSSDSVSKIEDNFFEPSYDYSDLLHQFTNDKYPNLQLAISP